MNHSNGNGGAIFDRFEMMKRYVIDAIAMMAQDMEQRQWQRWWWLQWILWQWEDASTDKQRSKQEKRIRSKRYQDNNIKNGATGKKRKRKLNQRLPTMTLFAEQMKKIFESKFPEEQAMACNSNSNNRNDGSSKSATVNNNKTKHWNTVLKKMLLGNGRQWKLNEPMTKIARMILASRLWT